MLTNILPSIQRRLRNNRLRRLHEPLRRHQAAHASPRLHLPHHHGMRDESLPKRRSEGLLRLISYHSHHDGPLHSVAVHCIRIAYESYATETETRLRSFNTLHSRWIGGRLCGCCDDTAGCYQDFATDARHELGTGDQACERAFSGRGDNMEERRCEGVLQRHERSRGYGCA